MSAGDRLFLLKPCPIPGPDDRDETMSQPVPMRPELPAKFRKLIVKIGSAALAQKESGVNQLKINDIVRDCQTLLSAGIQVLLVSSGAISIGRHTMAAVADETIDFLQACSAIGQPRLMNCYSQAFASHQRTCAQILLTHEDIRDRKRSLNLKNMINRLLAQGITPILNENDSVSFAEITVGDNDQLAAMLAEMLGADGLILLTTPDGLFNQDPGTCDASVISRVAYDEQFTKVNLKGKSAAGRGGMRTKLEAVRKLTPLGIPVMLATYKKDSPLLAALAGGGTYFEGSPSLPNQARHRWVLANVRLGAVIHIDKGAYEAILKNSSLLPSGISRVDGNFGRGDCVKIVCGLSEIASGLAEYSAVEMRKISGRNSDEIIGILGYRSSKVVVHKNNLFVKEIR